MRAECPNAPEEQVALLAGSIREYGFANPVLVDGENGVIAGHGRLLAARKLGLEQVPVIELGTPYPGAEAGLHPRRQQAGGAAGWDRELLALEVGELSELGIDVSGLGFEAGEIDALLHAGQPDPREEETPEPPPVPVSPAGRSLGPRAGPGGSGRRPRVRDAGCL